MGKCVFSYGFFCLLFIRDQYLSSNLDFYLKKTLILHPLDLSISSCKMEKANIHTVTSVSITDAYKVVQVSQSGRQPPWKRSETQTSPSEGELKDVHLDKSPVPNSGTTILVGLEVSTQTKCGSEDTSKTTSVSIAA